MYTIFKEHVDDEKILAMYKLFMCAAVYAIQAGKSTADSASTAQDDALFQKQLIIKYLALSPDDKEQVKSFEKHLLLRNDSSRPIKIWFDYFDTKIGDFVKQEPRIVDPHKKIDFGQLLFVRNIQFKPKEGLMTSTHQIYHEGSQQLSFIHGNEFSDPEDALIRLAYSKIGGALLPKWWWVIGKPPPKM